MGANVPVLHSPMGDPMHNADDVCMDRLTSEQGKRMRKHWHAFRDKKER